MLPKPTDRLLRTLDALPQSRGWVLAGGTALALRIDHRKSEDLDFVFTRAHLPRRRIQALLQRLRKSHRVVVIPDLAAEEDSLEAGVDLADHQQDYGVDGAKMSFFVPDPPSLRKRIDADSGVAGLRHIRVARLDSLFLMKALTLNRRIMTRDLFDLWTLIEKHGHSSRDVFRAADEYGYSSDVLKSRLLHASLRRDDPGLETTSRPAPTFAQLKAYFAKKIDELEQAEAEKAFRR